MDPVLHLHHLRMKLRLTLIVSSVCIAIAACGGGDTVLPRLASTVSVDISPCTGTSPQKSTPFDISVEGNSRLRLSRNGNVSFAPSGTFQLETTTAVLACSKYPAFSGYMVNSLGERVTGYALDSTGAFSTSLSELNIFTAGDISPSSTRSVFASMSLVANAAPLPLGLFSPDNAATYHFTTSVDVYDTLGARHTVALFFVKTASLAWEVMASAEGAVIHVGQLIFNSAGNLVTSASSEQLRITVPLTNGANPLSVSFELAGSTANSSSFVVNAVTQDGYAFGSVNGFTIAEDGVVTSRYDNGQTRIVGKIPLTM